MMRGPINIRYCLLSLLLIMSYLKIQKNRKTNYEFCTSNYQKAKFRVCVRCSFHFPWCCSWRRLITFTMELLKEHVRHTGYVYNSTFKTVQHFGPPFTVLQLAIGTHMSLDIMVHYRTLRTSVHRGSCRCLERYCMSVLLDVSELCVLLYHLHCCLTIENFQSRFRHATQRT